MNKKQWASWLAMNLEVEERDGWFQASDAFTYDGNPWVNIDDFIRICKENGYCRKDW